MKRVADIIALAAQMTGFSVAQIKGASRVKPLTLPRFAVYKIAFEHGHSYSAIGRTINRDHSSVIHGATLCVEYEQRLPDFAKFVARLRAGVETMEPFFNESDEPFIPARPLYTPKPRNVFAFKDDEGEAMVLYFNRNMREGSAALADAINAL